MNLEHYFSKFKKNIIGDDLLLDGPYGQKKVIYADWTASGRLYRPLEERLINDFGPYVANTHTETTLTGSAMTHAYHEARKRIKRHVGAGPNDVLITEGSGMTGVVSKFQRLLGLKLPEEFKEFVKIEESERPVVFVSHMEHHSNQTSWLETIAEVVVIPPTDDGLIDMNALEELLKVYKDRTVKIAAITAASNVTGIKTDYYKIADLMHAHKGLIFVDFACSGPYVDIDMHPSSETYLDAIFFSPHKFLGGPGSSGVLVFHSDLYRHVVPDHPGGGTVTFTNPWGGHGYIDDIETREDGGTPAFLQTIRIALAMELKDQMGVNNILKREEELNEYIFERLKNIPNLKILAGQHEDRLGIFSFYLEDFHYNLVVKILNDRYGIQTRGGCSCAGTYGHYLLHVDQVKSDEIVDLLNQGCALEKPGWIRMSIHPTTTNTEAEMICDAIEEIALNMEDFAKDYKASEGSNEFKHINELEDYDEIVEPMFQF